MDDLEIICPCCSSLIRFDDAGEPYAEEVVHADLKENEFRGLGNLVSIDATPQWRQQEYFHNQQIKHQHVAAPAPEQTEQSTHFEHEQGIAEALNEDLSNKGLKTNYTTE